MKAGNLIEWGAEYRNLYDGTPLEHLTVGPPPAQADPLRTFFPTEAQAWARAMQLVRDQLGEPVSVRSAAPGSTATRRPGAS